MEQTVSEQTSTTDEIFPKGTTKSYTLVEWMRGTSPMVGKGPDDTLFSFPVVLLWEINLLLGVTLAIFLFSLIKQAPLEQIANPMVTTDPAKAPWYFVGLQELLEHMHPTLAGIFIPGVLVVFLLTLPYIDRSRENIGVWFSTARGTRFVVGTALYTLLVVPTYIVLDNKFPLREILRGHAPSWIAQWFLPATTLIVIVSIPAIVAGLRKASVREILLVLFTVMLVSAVVLTVSGFLFSGPGFKLYWPWQMPDGYNPWTEF
jgi:menaquinol-cytochrome c reductase cytochrome b/c subunit